ncbi:MAG TPA: GNAT family N-acetyltransferase [Chloroflexota bacterium]
MGAPEVGSVEVRALASEAEVAAYFELAAATFPGYQQFHCTPAPGGSVAAGWRRFVLETPGFEPARLRGAFRDGALLGGLIHEERSLYVGPARLRSGYVGAVVVDPCWRGQGVATALLRDSTALARSRRQALIVLRGIADFYAAFGYVDVFETTEHAVDPARVLALPDPGYVVRPATERDAPALLALYDRHYGGRTGAYARSLPLQRHLLRHREEPPLLALDRAGQPRGYLILSGAGDRAGAVEAAADCWPAALALLRRHARARPQPPAELRWPLPPDAPSYYLLADHLPLRSETRSRPNAGWMARLADLEALFDRLLPLWRERWRRARVGWRGSLCLAVDEARCRLRLGDRELARQTEPSPHERELRLSPAALTQLIFGARPIAWLAAQPDQELPPDLAEVLAVLFPTGTAFYPFSNRC